MVQAANGRSLKKPVVERLYSRWVSGDFPDNIVRRSDVVSAINDENLGKPKKQKLSTGNPANFLKDMIRKKSVMDNWPARLIAEQISARQRYGEEKVFQFFKHPSSWPSPFPDWHAPKPGTPIYDAQTVSIDSLARSLGRSEETWLTQIAVNLHLVHAHLAIYSPHSLRRRIRDVRHLQMGIKTQPEIDAAFIATYRRESENAAENVFITLEAKQRDERILTDQIREQVAKAFDITKKLNDPPIHAVKPMALQVVRWPAGQEDGSIVDENMMFIVEFEAIGRDNFNLIDRSPSSEQLWDETVLPLKQCSSALYRLFPVIPALG